MQKTTKISNTILSSLAKTLEGELHFDQLMKVLYATDASVYRSLPLAVALPKSKQDIQTLINFAKAQQTSLIPRAAGTSLAGQCVGDGIVVDVSKYMNQILEFNKEERWVRLQPGVVRDELNEFLKTHDLFFSPITSTANRAMIGGMIGNNSCGSNSIVYGSTREHVLSMEVVLSDGSEATFKSLDKKAFEAKTEQDNLEGKLYRFVKDKLSNQTNQENIRTYFPKQSVHRRNTGYAIDYLLNTELFSEEAAPFNMCKLLCGSEGTLAFTTEATLHLDPLPPKEVVVVAAHFESINESLKANVFAMQQRPWMSELMDKIILDCTRANASFMPLRFFVEGDPAAVLCVEFRGHTMEEAEAAAAKLIEILKAENLGYSFPMVKGKDTAKVWKLRSAGLGLLANIPGDSKAVACVEDTAVDVEDLADYIKAFTEIMKGFEQEAVYYAHAGAGELHLRPILDLKKAKDVQQFYEISLASAKLVKKYKGSLSGEHGDGRLRAPFIPLMVGQENYQLFKALKHVWDKHNIFNPGKIIDAEEMNTSLRYVPGQATKKFDTLLDFSSTGGIMRAAEKCNGSGDCRKLPLSGGTMCPSYQATRNEKETTRARANTLREFLTQSNQSNAFDHKEIKEVMDLCLSCKGCTSECPSNVDMAGLKAEFQHQYYKSNGVPLRAKAFAYINQLNGLGSLFPGLYNFLLTNSLTSGIAKSILGVAPRRSLPKIHKRSLKKWYKKEYASLKQISNPIKTVYLFCDEFTNYNDTPVGVKAIQLLHALGYKVKMIEHAESGRAALSKGLLAIAKKVAIKNVAIFSKVITNDTPLIGIEPSAILSFRDEYPRLVEKENVAVAKQLSENTFTIEEFIANEIEAGNIAQDRFVSDHKKVLLHGHCHQKALSNIEQSIWMLSLPKHYEVELIPSGCCGMAGSFGYEAEHFEVSQQIGELVLFPALRKAKSEVIVAAAGTSCRHQIMDGVGKEALHPVEVLWAAVRI